MATFVLTDATATINSVVLDDRVRAVSIDYSAEPQDDTTMGAGTRTQIPGLLDWTIEIEFVQDFRVAGASAVDATLFALVGAAAFPIAVAAVSGGASATNPVFTTNGMLESYPPLGNTVGEIATTTARFRPSGASPTLTRIVA